MKRILLTGMSGNGKSSLIEALAQEGVRAIDTDHDPRWEEAGDGGMIWREDRVAALLDVAEPLVLSACVANQGKFYPRFDHVVLLSAPAEVLLGRLAARSNNPYGKNASEQAEVLQNIEQIEPLLRAGADVEIDTRQPFDEVLGRVLSLLD